MPSRIVLVHDDPHFVAGTATALEAAGYDVTSFSDTMTATNVLLTAKRMEVLITRVLFPEGQPNGVSLARMARVKRPGVKVLFVASPERKEYTDGIGELLPTPATAVQVVDTVRRMLADG